VLASALVQHCTLYIGAVMVSAYHASKSTSLDCGVHGIHIMSNTVSSRQPVPTVGNLTLVLHKQPMQMSRTPVAKQGTPHLGFHLSLTQWALLLCHARSSSSANIMHSITIRYAWCEQQGQACDDKDKMLMLPQEYHRPPMYAQ
jgi:hypothetical protein